jgi:hypothetical protein
MDYHEMVEEAVDDSSIIDQLQTFPSLRTLILRDMPCDEQALSLLLSLPLVHLDVLHLGVRSSERDSVYPCSLTLQTLFIPWWKCCTSLLHPYTVLREEGSGGVRSASLPWAMA